MLHTPVAKIPQEGISCSQREESQRGRPAGIRLREKPVHHFVGSTVPADPHELSLTLPFPPGREDVPRPRRGAPARNPRGTPAPRGPPPPTRTPPRPHPPQPRPQHLAAPPAPRRRIHDGQIRPQLIHSFTTAPRSTVLPNS